MYRVLFMPFLQIPSGHHHVADTIRYQLQEISPDFHCEKVDILSHCFGKVESFISSFYLQWIRTLPGVYSKIYKASVNGNAWDKRYYIYEMLFLKKVFDLVQRTDPDVIICTHALPSYLLDLLKRKKKWSKPVINVYTDYFINDLWGMKHIDYHFAPSAHSKQLLMERGIEEEKIFVTGIPVHPVFKQEKKKRKNAGDWCVLISGGNMGAGSVERLVRTLNPTGSVQYYVLCGKNKALYQSMKQLNHPSIYALPYIDSKEKMNQLYDEADAIITKPGGVTVTECLWKQLPIFVYEALPGQEEFNLNYLSKQGLIYHPADWDAKKPTEERIIEVLTNDFSVTRLQSFSKSIKDPNPAKIVEGICRRKDIS